MKTWKFKTDEIKQIIFVLFKIYFLFFLITCIHVLDNVENKTTYGGKLKVNAADFNSGDGDIVEFLEKEGKNRVIECIAWNFMAI